MISAGFTLGIKKTKKKTSFPPDGGSHVKSADPNVCANVVYEDWNIAWNTSTAVGWIA